MRDKVNCSKLSEQIPIINPSKLNETHDRKSINNISKGYSRFISTKNVRLLKSLYQEKMI